MKLTNRNSFPMTVRDIGFNLVLADTDVGRCGTTKEVVCRPNAPQAVEIGLGVSPRDLGLAAFRMLSGDGAGYRLTGGMKVGTPYGPLNIPLEKAGRTLFK